MYHVMNPNEAKVYSIETFSDDSNMLESYLRGTLRAGIVPHVERHDLGVTVVTRLQAGTRHDLVRLGCIDDCVEGDFTPEADVLSRMAQCSIAAGT